jgi:hypothetical protein
MKGLYIPREAMLNFQCNQSIVSNERTTPRPTLMAVIALSNRKGYQIKPRDS